MAVGAWGPAGATVPQTIQHGSGAGARNAQIRGEGGGGGSEDEAVERGGKRKDGRRDLPHPNNVCEELGVQL